MEERRFYDKKISDVTSDIALIKKDLEYIKRFIEDDREKMKDHIESSDTFREKVTHLQGLEADFQEHKIADRWIQALIATTQIAIIAMLVKLVIS